MKPDVLQRLGQGFRVRSAHPEHCRKRLQVVLSLAAAESLNERREITGLSEQRVSTRSLLRASSPRFRASAPINGCPWYSIRFARLAANLSILGLANQVD